jgi:O-antigen/teichoic acid export membrane protein
MLIYLLEPALQNFSEYGPSLVLAGLNRSLLATLLALYRNEKRLRFFIMISFIAGILRSGFQLTGVLYYDLSFLGYVHGTAVGGSVISLGLIVYSYYRCGFHYNKSILKNLSSFVRPLFFTDLLLWGLLFADRFFLLRNPADLGIYDNAMKFAIGVQLIIQGLINATQPEIFRYLKEGIKVRSSEIKTLTNLFLAESIGITVITIIPVMLFITLFYETALNQSAGLITIIFVRFILTSQYQVFAMPLIYAKKTRIFFYLNSFVLFLSLGINWLLTPVLGYYGAIIAFFSANIIQVILFSIMQQKYTPINWNKNKVLYFPIAVVFTAILLEITKLVFGADPFLTASFFVLFAFGGLAFLYKTELKKYFLIWLSK